MEEGCTCDLCTLARKLAKVEEKFDTMQPLASSDIEWMIETMQYLLDRVIAIETQNEYLELQIKGEV